MKKLLIVLLALCLCCASALAAELTTNGGAALESLIRPSAVFRSAKNFETLKGFKPSATKITNLGAMKIVLGWKRFIIYILFTMAFAWGTGMIVDLLI